MELLQAFSCAAVCCFSATAALAVSEPQQLIPLGGSCSVESTINCSLGLEELVLGDIESAQMHFQAVLDEFPDQPLALCGLLISRDNEGERRKRLAKLTEFVNSEQTTNLTPPELFYLKQLLTIACGDLSGASDAFAERAKRFRRDHLAAAWSIILAHYAQRDAGKTLQRYEELRRCCGESKLLSYARALVEEDAEQISDEAIQAATHAATISPQARLLHAHLLYRRQEFDEAAQCFRLASEETPPERLHHEIAQSYLVMALWSAGQFNEAQALLEGLCQAVPMQGMVTAVDFYKRWETQLIPLRLLLCSPRAPSQSEIQSAKSLVVSGENRADEKARLNYRSALVALAVARYAHARGRAGEASEWLNHADEYMSLFRQEIQAESSGPISAVCHRRALRCFEEGKARVRAEVFRDSSTIWEEQARELRQPTELCLPPLLPSPSP